MSDGDGACELVVIGGCVALRGCCFGSLSVVLLCPPLGLLQQQQEYAQQSQGAAAVAAVATAVGAVVAGVGLVVVAVASWAARDKLSRHFSSVASTHGSISHGA